jgi:hypothetical protein
MTVYLFSGVKLHSSVCSKDKSTPASIQLCTQSCLQS